MRKIQGWYCLIFIICSHYSVLSLDIDDLCYHDTKKVSGQCKLLSNCPDAIQDLKNRIYPKHCGFIRDSVIVCCPEIKQIPTTHTPSSSENVHAETTTSYLKPVVEIQNTLPPVSTTTPSSEVITETDSSSPKPDKKRPGERSKYWCEKFEDLAYKTEMSPLLIGKPQMMKVGICPRDEVPQISGGVRTKLGEFPHMALLKYKGRSQCGGVLVSETFVITAAHCIDTENNLVPIIVRLGDLNITNPNDDIYVQELPVKKVHVHPDFKHPVQYNDIALIELAKPAVLSEYLKPICLYDKEKIDFRSAMVTGWGKTEDDVTSSHLLRALVSIFSQESCNQVYRDLVPVFPNGIDYDLEICAGSHVSNQDACKGDSGGPLQIYHSSRYCSYSLIGITSFGLRCGEANVPGVYTKVYPYLEWIEDIVWPE